MEATEARRTVLWDDPFFYPPNRAGQTIVLRFRGLQPIGHLVYRPLTRRR
jgi:hypothetical protein